MRVAFIASHAHGYDGWGRYTVELMRALQPHDIDPVLISTSERLDPALEGIEHYPILPPLFTRRFETPRSLLVAPLLRSLMADCDLVHCAVELFLPLAALAAGKKPLVASVYGTWAIRPFESASQGLFFRPALSRVDRLIVLSHFTRDWMARLVSLPEHRILTAGVHPEPFMQPSQVSLPDWAAAGQVLLTVGAVKARKGQHLSLEAFRQVADDFPDLHYVIVGSLDTAPGYVAGLRQQITDGGLADRVHLLGSLPFENLIAWYQAADVFMMLSSNQGSSFEGLGLVYLEAGAAGRPSIGTLDCGAEEAIKAGETGFLVAQNDPQAATNALRTLFSDDSLRQKMGLAARQYAQSLTWARLGEEVAAIYDELLGGGE